MTATLDARSSASGGVTRSPRRSIAKISVLLTQDLDLSAVRITTTAIARGIDTSCVAEFAHLVAAPVDVTAQVSEFMSRIGVGYFGANT